MLALRTVLRIYSYIFEAILCLLAIGVSGVTLLSGNEDLVLGWMPWTGRTLLIWLLALGVAGLLCVLLALAARLRFPLFLFSVMVFAILARGFLFSSYSFPEPGAVKVALLLIGGALLAAIGAWPTPRPSTLR